MLETHLSSPVTRRRLRTGPAAEHIDVFADWLHRQGYKPSSIDNLLTSLAGWTDWMLATGFTIQDSPSRMCWQHSRPASCLLRRSPAFASAAVPTASR